MRLGAASASRSWMRVMLLAGAILAVALLAQTIVGYGYVSRNLIEQAGRRVAIDRVRSVEQAMRLARPADAAAVQQLLDDQRQPVAEVASLELIGADGTVFATSGGPVSPALLRT